MFGIGGAASASASITIDTGQAVGAVKALQGQLRDLGNTKLGGGGFTDFITKNEHAINDLGKGLTAVGAVAGVAFGFGIKSAADFQQGMADISAVTGATGDDLAKLRERALQIGKDTKFSAGQAQVAIAELGKAGLSVDDIYNGAAGAVTNLSTATGTDLATSATIVSAALTQFGLKGQDATKVVDMLTNGANASLADVTGIGDALSYVGNTAHDLGIPLNDTITSIAALSDRGIDASSAGTGLREVFASMAKPTQEAQQAMDAAGLSFFDASGNLKPMPNLIKDVTTATAGMTTEQRQNFLQTVFGIRGGAVMNALLSTQTEEAKKAGKSWDDYSQKINKSGTAAAQAKIKMNTLSGSMENLRGSIETAAIIAFTPFLGPLKTIVDGINKLVGAFIDLPGPIQTALAALTGITAALGLAGGGFLLMLPRIASTIEAFQKLGGLSGIFGTMGRGVGLLLGPLSGLLIPILAIAAAIGLLYLAYKTNFLGIGDLIDKGIAGTRKFASNFTKAWSDLGGKVNPVSRAILSFSAALKGIGGDHTPAFIVNFALGLDALAAGVAKFGSYIKSAFNLGSQFKQLDKFGPVARGFVGSIGILAASAGKLVKAFQTGGFTGLAKEIPNTIGHIGDAFQSLSTGIARSIKDIGNTFKPLKSITDPLSKAFYDAGLSGQHLFHALGDLAKGDFKGAFQDLSQAGKRFGMELGDLGKAGVAAVTKLGDGLQKGIGQSVDYLSNRFPAFSGLWQRLGGIMGGTVGVVKNLAQAFGDLIQGNFSGAFHNLGQAATDGLKVIGNAMGTLPSLIAGVFKSINWGNVGSALQSGLGKASDLAFKGLNAAGGAIAKGWDGLTNALSNFSWSGLGNALQNGLQSASNMAFSALNAAGGALSGAWDWIKNAASNIPWGDIANTITGGAAGALGNLAGAIAGAAGDLWGWIKDKVGDIDWKGLGSTVKNGFLGLVKPLESPTFFTDHLTGLWDWLKGFGGKIKDAVGDGASILKDFGKGIADGLKAGFSAAWDAVVAYITARVNDLISVVNSAIRAINKALPGPDIPTIPLIGALGQISDSFNGAAKSATHYATTVGAAMDAARHALDFVFAPAKAQQPGNTPGPRPEQQQQQGQVTPVSPVGAEIGKAIAVNKWLVLSKAILGVRSALKFVGDGFTSLAAPAAAANTALAPIPPALTNIAAQATAVGAMKVVLTVSGDNSGAITSIGGAVGALGAADGLSATNFVLGKNDNALGSIGTAIGALAAADGLTATDFMLGDNRDALGSIGEALGTLSAADGQTALDYVLGDNSNALRSIGEALGALASAAGQTATTIIDCINNVPAAVGAALGSLAQAAGASATTYIDVVTRYSSIGSAAVGAIPRFAKGGIVGYASGGLTDRNLVLVGEQGPELAYLPTGTYIQPHGASMATLRNLERGGNVFNNNPTINIYQQPGEDPDTLAQRVAVAFTRSMQAVR